MFFVDYFFYTLHEYAYCGFIGVTFFWCNHVFWCGAFYLWGNWRWRNFWRNGSKSFFIVSCFGFFDLSLDSNTCFLCSFGSSSDAGNGCSVLNGEDSVGASGGLFINYFIINIRTIVFWNIARTCILSNTSRYYLVIRIFVNLAIWRKSQYCWHFLRSLFYRLVLDVDRY